MASRFRHACVVSALVSLSIGCHGKLNVAPTGNDAGTIDPPGAIPFEPVSARIYVAKVKNLMLGLPPTEEEIAAVEADPTALRGLVDAWFVRPEAQAKLGTFFSKAFQQTQIGPARLLRSAHRRQPPQPAAVHAAARVDVAHGAEDDRERPAVHRHRHDAHVHDDADDDVALPGARSAAGGRRRQGVRSACPCPTARSARRRRSGSPTGRPSIRARRRWWRTRSRSPRRWTRPARTSCTSPCRPRSPAACRSWMTPGTSSSTTRAPR